MANRKLSCAMLYRWFKCKLKPPKNGIGKQKAKEFKATIIEAESSEPKRRGRKRKNNDETSKPETGEVVKGKKKDGKTKKDMKHQRRKR